MNAAYIACLSPMDMAASKAVGRDAAGCVRRIAYRAPVCAFFKNVAVLESHDSLSCDYSFKLAVRERLNYNCAQSSTG